jgi:ankyrin repeat protein
MADLAHFHDRVKAGDLAVIETLLREDPSLLNARNELGQNAILLAKYYGQNAVADHLLRLGPELDVFTAAAAGVNDFVIAEVKRDPALLAAHSTDGWTLLHLAAFFGHADLALHLIEAGAEVDARSTNSMKNTPLHAAAAGRKVNVVRLLLSEKADSNAKQTGGWTALHAAAQNGDREIVELLIAYGADLGVRADNNQSPFDLALLKGHREVAELIDELRSGAA